MQRQQAAQGQPLVDGAGSFFYKTAETTPPSIFIVIITVASIMLIKISENNLAEVLKKAVAVLNDGGIVAYPTETFYGLGVKFDKENSLKKLFERGFGGLWCYILISTLV